MQHHSAPALAALPRATPRSERSATAVGETTPRSVPHRSGFVATGLPRRGGGSGTPQSTRSQPVAWLRRSAAGGGYAESVRGEVDGDGARASADCEGRPGGGAPTASRLETAAARGSAYANKSPRGLARCARSLISYSGGRIIRAVGHAPHTRAQLASAPT